jgi:hypothetical protein
MQKKKKERDELIKSDIENIGDPFLSMGYGLIAYRTTMFNLAMAFIAFSIFTYPIIGIYKTGTYAPEGSRTQTTLGNLGFASIECK